MLAAEDQIHGVGQRPEIRKALRAKVILMPAHCGVSRRLCRESIIPVAANHAFAVCTAPVHNDIAMRPLACQVSEADDARDAAAIDIGEGGLEGGQVAMDIRDQRDAFQGMLLSRGSVGR